MLKAQGRDYGPWSIYYYLIDDLGLEHPPARSTIALWLHEAGVAEANARKRPRKSYKRWARDKVDELWQLDGFVYRWKANQDARAITEPPTSAATR